MRSIKHLLLVGLLLLCTPSLADVDIKPYVGKTIFLNGYCLDKDTMGLIARTAPSNAMLAVAIAKEAGNQGKCTRPDNRPKIVIITGKFAEFTDSDGDTFVIIEVQPLNEPPNTTAYAIIHDKFFKKVQGKDT